MLYFQDDAARTVSFSHSDIVFLSKISFDSLFIPYYCSSSLSYSCICYPGLWQQPNPAGTTA